MSWELTPSRKGDNKIYVPIKVSDLFPLNISPSQKGQSLSKIWNETHIWYLEDNTDFWKFLMKKFESKEIYFYYITIFNNELKIAYHQKDNKNKNKER